MNAPSSPPPDLAAAREQFFGLVDGLRPEMHRYASRLVGSAIDGEDIVQDALAKAFYAMSLAAELPPLRPWLFRITKNTAIDFLRRYEHRNVEPLPAIEPMGHDDDFPRDHAALQVSLSAFMALPVNQRSAVILKDVLDASLAEIAEHLGVTTQAVKALLVRGRAGLRAQAANVATTPASTASSAEHRALVARYVALFNARDWPGVQGLLLEEVRLDLVAKSQRQGKSVGGYFGRYAQDPDVELRTGTCEGREVIGVFRSGATAPEYIILLESDDGRIAFIRDFRYVPYMAGELAFVAD